VEEITMVRKSSLSFSALVVLSVASACSRTNNDVGSVVRDSGSTGGLTGSGGTVSTGGASVGGAGGLQRDASGCTCGDGTLTWDCYCGAFNCNKTWDVWQSINSTSGLAGLEEYAGCNLGIVHIKEGMGPWGRHVFDLSTGRLIGDETAGDVAMGCPYGPDGSGFSTYRAGVLAAGASCVRSKCLGTLSPGAAPCGSGGTGGSPGSGGIVGTGGNVGAGGIVGTGGKGGVGTGGKGGVGTGGTSGGGEPSYCASCVDEAVAKTSLCPAQRPASESELRAFCQTLLQTGIASATVAIGGCKPTVTMPGCTPVPADTTVDLLSASFSPPSGFDCQYSRATGALLGITVVNDSPRFCGNQAYVAQSTGIANPWCIASGTLSVTCSSLDGGTDAPADVPAPDVPEERPTIDGGVTSVCPACGADELCVATYDGMCNPGSTFCRKVSAETKYRIIVDHEACFMKPLGDEVCGNVPGRLTWGCGSPPCLSEPLVADINCYGI
jgi:hypothetical protein